VTSDVTAEQRASIRAEVVEEIAREFETRAEQTRREAFTPASGGRAGRDVG
jgi:hypothetical protein